MDLMVNSLFAKGNFRVLGYTKGQLRSLFVQVSPLLLTHLPISFGFDSFLFVRETGPSLCKD